MKLGSDVETESNPGRWSAAVAPEISLQSYV